MYVSGFDVEGFNVEVVCGSEIEKESDCRAFRHVRVSMEGVVVYSGDHAVSAELFGLCGVRCCRQRGVCSGTPS